MLKAIRYGRWFMNLTPFKTQRVFLLKGKIILILLFLLLFTSNVSPQEDKENLPQVIKSEKCTIPFQLYEVPQKIHGKITILYLLLEANYFKRKTLTKFFNCLSAKYQTNYNFQITVYSDEENLKIAIGNYHHPPDDIDPPIDTSKSDCKNLQKAIKPCPIGYYRAIYYRGIDGEYFDYSPNPNKRKMLRITRKKRSKISGEL